MNIVEQVTQTIVSKYAQKISEEIERHEKIKKLKKPYSPWIWGSLGAWLGWIVGHSWLYALGGMFAVLLIVGLFRPRYRKNYLLADDIADEAIVLLGKHYFSKIKFYRDVGMSEEEFGTLFDETPDDYTSEFTLKGIYEGLRFRICNVEASYEEENETSYTDDDGNTQTDTDTREVEIFKGTIIRLTLPIRFDRSITVGPFQSREVMDHPAFNAIYGVSCRDRVYARYILTQSFMDNLVHLRSRLNRTPEIRFMGKHIYVMLHSLQNFDDLSFGNVEMSIENYYREIDFSASILQTIGFENHHIINNSRSA